MLKHTLILFIFIFILAQTGCSIEEGGEPTSPFC
jgi:hypothetical protein